MNEDQFWRGAITAASLPVLALVIQKAKAYLSRAWYKEGTALPNRLGYRLGKLWASRNRATK